MLHQPKWCSLTLFNLGIPVTNTGKHILTHWGDVFLFRSRRGAGVPFADFCCRNWVPLILVLDNIGEHIGGDLIDECRKRNVKSAFICPHHPQQNYVEGYLGRVTAMASFAMVYSGSPLYMWIWAIKTAVFIYNITASYFSRQKVWTTPYEVIHGEPFPDASIVVPFGCAALILLDVVAREKFKCRCSRSSCITQLIIRCSPTPFSRLGPRGSSIVRIAFF
jgi:hypothetical protein